MTNGGKEDVALARSTYQALRVKAKLLLRRITLIPSFCKRCGRDVKDFHAPDDVWCKVESHIPDGSVLCYSCFVDACIELGEEPVWRVSYAE